MSCGQALENLLADLVISPGRLQKRQARHVGAVCTLRASIAEVPQFFKAALSKPSEEASQFAVLRD